MTEYNALGLVLAGGGGKGAYQIGVWKALEELDYTRTITHVSGTSVGALNAALFCTRNLQKAISIWQNINTDTILDQSQSKKTISLFTAPKFSFSDETLRTITKLINEEKSEGLFSRRKLQKIIKTQVDLTKIKSSTIRTYACCHHKKDNRTEYFSLNNQKPQKIIDILLASSAIPGIFDSSTIDGIEYFDGGLSDNVPIKPLYIDGCRLFIVVHLSQKSKIQESMYPDAKIVNIYPSIDLGGLLDGTLNFNAQKIESLMEIGHSDCLRCMKK